MISDPTHTSRSSFQAFCYASLRSHDLALLSVVDKAAAHITLMHEFGQSALSSGSGILNAAFHAHQGENVDLQKSASNRMLKFALFTFADGIGPNQKPRADIVAANPYSNQLRALIRFHRRNTPFFQRGRTQRLVRLPCRLFGT